MVLHVTRLGIVIKFAVIGIVLINSSIQLTDAQGIGFSPGVLTLDPRFRQPQISLAGIQTIPPGRNSWFFDDPVPPLSQPISTGRISSFRQSQPISTERISSFRQSQPISAERISSFRQSQPISTERILGFRQSQPISAERISSVRQSQPISLQIPQAREVVVPGLQRSRISSRDATFGSQQIGRQRQTHAPSTRLISTGTISGQSSTGINADQLNQLIRSMSRGSLSLGGVGSQRGRVNQNNNALTQISSGLNRINNDDLSIRSQSLFAEVEPSSRGQTSSSQVISRLQQREHVPLASLRSNLFHSGAHAPQLHHDESTDFQQQESQRIPQEQNIIEISIQRPLTTASKPVATIPQNAGVNIQQPSSSIGTLQPISHQIKSADAQQPTKFTSVGIQQPTGQQISSVGIQQTTGQQISSIGIQQPTGQQIASVGIQQPTGQQITSVGIQQPTGQQITSIGIQQPVSQQIHTVGIQQPVGLQTQSAGNQQPVSQQTSATATQLQAGHQPSGDPLFEELVRAFTDVLQKPSASQQLPVQTVPQIHNQHPQTALHHSMYPQPQQPIMQHGGMLHHGGMMHHGGLMHHGPFAGGMPHHFGMVNPWMRGMDSAMMQEMMFGDTTDPPDPVPTTTVAPPTTTTAAAPATAAAGKKIAEKATKAAKGKQTSTSNKTKSPKTKAKISKKAPVVEATTATEIPLSDLTTAVTEIIPSDLSSPAESVTPAIVDTETVPTVQLAEKVAPSVVVKSRVGISKATEIKVPVTGKVEASVTVETSMKSKTPSNLADTNVIVDTLVKVPAGKTDGKKEQVNAKLSIENPVVVVTKASPEPTKEMTYSHLTPDVVTLQPLAAGASAQPSAIKTLEEKIMTEVSAMLSNSQIDSALLSQVVSQVANELHAKQTEQVPSASQLGLKTLGAETPTAKLSKKELLDQLKGSTRGVVVYPPTPPTLVKASHISTSGGNDLTSGGNGFTSGVNSIPYIRNGVTTVGSSLSDKNIDNTVSVIVKPSSKKIPPHIDVPTMPPSTGNAATQPEVYRTLDTILDHNPSAVLKVLEGNPKTTEAPIVRGPKISVKSLVYTDPLSNLPNLQSILTDISNAHIHSGKTETGKTKTIIQPTDQSVSKLNPIVYEPMSSAVISNVPSDTEVILQPVAVSVDQTASVGMQITESNLNQPAINNIVLLEADLQPSGTAIPSQYRSSQPHFSYGNAVVSDTKTYKPSSQPTGQKLVHDVSVSMIGEEKGVPFQTTKIGGVPVVSDAPVLANVEGIPVSVKKLSDVHADHLVEHTVPGSKTTTDSTGVLSILQEIQTHYPNNIQIKQDELKKQLSDPVFVNVLRGLLRDLLNESKKTTPIPRKTTTISPLTTTELYPEMMTTELYPEIMTSTALPVSTTEEVEVELEDLITTPKPKNKKRKTKAKKS